MWFLWENKVENWSKGRPIYQGIGWATTVKQIIWTMLVRQIFTWNGLKHNVIRIISIASEDHSLHQKFKDMKNERRSCSLNIFILPCLQIPIYFLYYFLHHYWLQIITILETLNWFPPSLSWLYNEVTLMTNILFIWTFEDNLLIVL